MRALATSSADGKDSAEVLHNSMSDGFYDVKDRQVAHAEPGAQPQPPRPRNMQEAMSSLSEPNYLMNSMSGKSVVERTMVLAASFGQHGCCRNGLVCTA